jgi:hypothetical protein
MHKGEFYTLLPKDAKDIKCTIEVFKKKSRRRRSKPRTVSLQGREDDEALSTVIDNSIKAAPYVVPARRREREVQAIPICSAKKDASQFAHVMVGSIPVQSTPADDVEPRFRTPCTYLMVGRIAIKV